MSTAPDGGTVRVVVAYATAQQEILRPLELAAGATLAQAIDQSGILQEIGVDNVDGAACPAGIFGKKKPPDTVLRDGDRVELYRPLLADPKESRRRRAGNKAAS